jgi:hypothetical protein
VLHVVVTAADSEIVLAPDNLHPYQQPDRLKTVLYDCGLGACVPHVSYIAREQRPRLTPISTVIIRHLTDGAARMLLPDCAGRCSAVAPRWIILDT